MTAVRGEDEPTGPERKCIGTGASAPIGGLVRFVVGPDGTVVPDLEERLPGRGFWLSAKRDVVEKATKRRAFAKAARRAVTVPEDLADRLEALLSARLIELLGLARRAGEATVGFDKAGERIRAGGAGLVLIAADAGRDGTETARMARSAGSPVARVLTSQELGRAFGRERAVHVAIGRGRLAERIERDALRLSGFRADAPAPEDGPAGADES